MNATVPPPVKTALGTPELCSCCGLVPLVRLRSGIDVCPNCDRWHEMIERDT